MIYRRTVTGIGWKIGDLAHLIEKDKNGLMVFRGFRGQGRSSWEDVFEPTDLTYEEAVIISNL